MLIIAFNRVVYYPNILMYNNYHSILCHYLMAYKVEGVNENTKIDIKDVGGIKEQ